jgi:hypothetical protein
MNSKKFIAAIALSDNMPDSRLCKSEMEVLEKALEDETRLKDFKICKFYDAVIARYDRKKNRSITLPPGSYFELFPMLQENQTQSIFVFGPKGSEKTWFAVSVARN